MFLRLSSWLAASLLTGALFAQQSNVVSSTSSVPSTLVPEPFAIIASPQVPPDHAYSIVAPHPAVSNNTSTSSSYVRLQQILQEAQKNLNKDSFPKIETASEKVKKAISQVEKFIVIDSEDGKKWSKFIRLPEIREQLEAKSPSFFRLSELHMNLRQNYSGLEYTPFIQLRDALDAFAVAAKFHTKEERFTKFFNDELEQLLKETKEAGQITNAINSKLVGILHNLYEGNQASDQVRQLQSLYSSQNVKLIVDESLVKKLTARPVAKPQDVNECILGTRVIGDAFLSGDIALNLIPMQNGFGFQVELNACMSSQSRGYNRNIVFNTLSSSPIVARKQVYLSETAVTTNPVSVSTNLNSTIQSIEHPLRIVRRLAARKSVEQKPRSEAVAEGRLQDRIGRQLTEQVDQAVSQIQPKLAEFRNLTVPELKRLDIDKPDYQFTSTDTSILANATVVEPGKLAAPSECRLPRPSASIVGQVHQSAVCNALAILLGGRTVRNHSLGDYVRQFTGKFPDELKDEIEGEPWSFTFNPAEPIRIDFDDDLIAVTIRIIRITRGKQSPLDDPISITVKYRPQIHARRLSFTRQGEVQVTSDKNTQGTRATNLRSFIQNKFDKTLRQSFTTEPITLNTLLGRFPRAKNINFDMDRVTFAIDDGWLQIAIPL